MGLTNDPPSTSLPLQLPPGMAFDSTTNRLYMLCPFGSGPPGTYNPPPLILVYQLN